ncbi:MAG TPA: lysophospholipid acyltransferase family protein [Microvirga sp.]|nr:lysophospholipid acyltransferase family protein [Microvirga sp.]
MLLVRSFLFNVAFFLNTLLWLILLLPLLATSHETFMRGPKLWARSSLWLLRVIAGTKVEFRGLERIPPGGLLVAAKHQSAWETFALVPLFEDPTFILKRELMWIPIFGWYLAKARCVAIDRRAGSQALAQMNTRARAEVQAGRQIFIFPEGTRKPPGARPAYKYGVAHLYENLGVPCLPVALNAGLYWPRRAFIRRPGTIRVEILEPIPPGMPRDAFFALLQAQIEAASNRLLAEAEAELGIVAPGRTAAASSSSSSP